MRRLTALIKTIVPFPAEIREEFFKIMKVLDLMPGEWIPDDLPTGTQIFVEEGFLLLTIYDDKQWRCTNFYIEGTATATYSEGAAEMKEGSCRVRATEPSRIYYLTPEDYQRIEEIFPAYKVASMALQHRSFLKSEQRKALFSVPPMDRVLYVDNSSASSCVRHFRISRHSLGWKQNWIKPFTTLYKKVGFPRKNNCPDEVIE